MAQRFRVSDWGLLGVQLRFWVRSSDRLSSLLADQHLHRRKGLSMLASRFFRSPIAGPESVGERGIIYIAVYKDDQEIVGVSLEDRSNLHHEVSTLEAKTSKYGYQLKNCK